MLIRVTDQHGADLFELAAGLLGKADALAREMAAHIRRELKDQLEDVPQEDLEDSCRRELRSVLGVLAGRAQLDITAGLRTGRRRAEQNAPESTVLGGYRIGVRFLWEVLVTEAAVTGLVGSDALVRAASAIWAIHDELVETMITGYREAITERQLAREQERSAVVEALLTGMTVGTKTLWAAAEALRLPKRGPFVVVAAEAPEVGRQALPRVEAALRRQDMHSSWRLRPDTHIGIVHLRTPAKVAELVDVLRRDAVLRVGVSPVYHDLYHTGPNLRFATIAMLSGHSGSPTVTVFDDNPVPVATAAAPEVTQRLARTVLGGLETLGATERDLLLDTLETWVDSGGSTEETAKLMFCHPNTIRLRLRRISEHTGRSISQPRDVTELCLALYAIRQTPKPATS
jgi:hypothetical protein